MEEAAVCLLSTPNHSPTPTSLLSGWGVGESSGYLRGGFILAGGSVFTRPGASVAV